MTSILFLAPDPTDASRLRLGEELREIQEKLRLAKLRDCFRLHERMSVRPTDVSQALLDVNPQVVHFAGHGLPTGALCFEDELGRIHPIEPDALGALFEQFSDQVDCVILNACYSEAQAESIAKHISYVIGMKQAVGDKAAIAFAVGFYQALGAGRSIGEAYRLGCVQVRLQNIPEHLMPILRGKATDRVQFESGLRILEKTPSGEEVRLETNSGFVVIGRSPKSDVQLKDDVVSWEHGNILLTENEYIYRHVSSTNPTYVKRHNEQFLLRKDIGTEIALKNNDRILVGKHILVVQFNLFADLEGYTTTKEENSHDESVR